MRRIPPCLLLLLLCAPLPAQLIPPENAAPWSYVAPPLEGHCLQTYRLYLPKLPPSEMPADGWPVLIHLDMKAFAITLDVPVDASDLFGRLLDEGVAVITARATPGMPHYVPDPVDPDSHPIPFQGFQTAYGDECNIAPGVPPGWPGHGIFHAPGVVPPDLADTGIAPYDSPDYPICEKDAVMLIQHVRHLARKTAPFASTQEALMSQLDHRRIAVEGTSAGAAALMWAVLGPDRRDEPPFAGLGGQYEEPTQAGQAILGGALMWWPLFRSDLLMPICHFGYQGDSELLPSPMMLGDALPEELQAASPLYFADPVQAASIHTYLRYEETSVCEDYVGLPDPASCPPYELCFEDQGLDGYNLPGGTAKGLHPAWSGYTWKTLYPERTRLVIETPAAYAQANGVDAVPIYGGAEEEDTDALLWLLERFDALISWAAAPAASAGPGTRVHGLLPEDGIHSIAVEAVAGTTLSAKVKRKAGGLQPALRVISPDGSWLVAPGDTVVGPKKAVVPKMVVDQTGTYRLEVLGTSLPGGEYRMRAKASSPAKIKEVLTVGPDDGRESLSFDAVAGTTLASLVVSQAKPPKGAAGALGGVPAKLLPEVAALLLPDGGQIDLSGLVKTTPSGKKVKVGKLVLPETGTYTLTIAGAEDSVGYALVTLKLKAPKGPKKVEIF